MFLVRMLPQIVLTFSGIMAFLYIFWKRLKEDFSSNIIFSVAFSLIFAILGFSGLSNLFFKDLWFWADVAGLVLVGFFCITRFKLKVFETVDATVCGILPWLSLVFIYDSVGRENIYSLGGFFIIVSVYLLYHFLNSSYKKFTWYRSGKVGFAGLVTLGIIFLLRTFASLLFVDMLSFVDRFDLIVSAFGAIICFGAVVYLSRN